MSFKFMLGDLDQVRLLKLDLPVCPRIPVGVFQGGDIGTPDVRLYLHHGSHIAEEESIAEFLRQTC